MLLQRFLQSIFVLNAFDSNDKNFQFQFRCLQDKSKKIDFEKLKDYLKTNTTTLCTKKRILHYPGYQPATMDETIRAQELFKLFPEIQHAEFVYNKVLFRKGEEEIKGLKFLDFFKIFSFQKNTNNTILLGYEIPETIDQDITPNCCIYSIDKKTLVNKSYLFPYSSKSLQKLANQTAMKEFPGNARKLKILYFSEDTHPHRNIYLTLQQCISEILAHLERPKFFGNAATDKLEIFLALSKMISDQEPLASIKDFLNSYDKVEILSKHRDPWGIFAFFKGETHSALAWNELRKMLPNNLVHPTEPSFSWQPR